MNLTDAISAAEAAQTAYTGAVAQTANDQSAIAAAQAKLDAANAVIANDNAAQNTAAVALNSSLDDLIAAATAAKIPAPVTDPAPLPPVAVSGQ